MRKKLLKILNLNCQIYSVINMYDPKITHAVYRGDTFIAVGSLEELASLLGVKIETVKKYTMPSHWDRALSYAKRILVIKLED